MKEERVRLCLKDVVGEYLAKLNFNEESLDRYTITIGKFVFDIQFFINDKIDNVSIDVKFNVRVEWSSNFYIKINKPFGGGNLFPLCGHTIRSITDRKVPTYRISDQGTMDTSINHILYMIQEVIIPFFNTYHQFNLVEEEININGKLERGKFMVGAGGFPMLNNVIVAMSLCKVCRPSKFLETATHIRELFFKKFGEDDMELFDEKFEAIKAHNFEPIPVIDTPFPNYKLNEFDGEPELDLEKMEYKPQIIPITPPVAKAETKLIETIKVAGFESNAEPSIRIYENGAIQVAFNMMPATWMKDSDFNNFDIHMQQATELEVIWEDREFFYLPKSNNETISKLISFLENYRKERGYN